MVYLTLGGSETLTPVSCSIDDTVGEFGSGHQPLESRRPRRRTRDAPQPVRDPVHIDRRPRRRVLQPRLGQPDVPAATQAEPAHALRQRPLDPRPHRVLLLPLRGLLPDPRRLQRLVPLPRPQRHLTTLRLGARAPRTARAGQALAAGELGVDHLIAPPVLTRLPEDARLALRAGHPRRLPVDREMGDVEPLVRPSLPAHVGAHRAHQPAWGRPGPPSRPPCSNWAPTSNSASTYPASTRWSPGSRPLVARAV